MVSKQRLAPDLETKPEVRVPPSCNGASLRYSPFVHTSRVSKERLAVDKGGSPGTTFPQGGLGTSQRPVVALSLIHISEPTRHA